MRKKPTSRVSLDTAVKSYRKNKDSKISARGRLRDLSPESLKLLKENLSESPSCPHVVTVGKAYTLEVTLLSPTLATTTINITDIRSRDSFFDNLERLA